MKEFENQLFLKPVTEVIKNRISIRSYKPKMLAEELKENIIIFIENLSGPFNAKVRFKLVDSSMLLENDHIKLGTYGMIRGASSFIVSAVENAEMNLEELGYEFEKLILYAHSLGLGTCWLGGTFKKGEFSKAMNLNSNELLPTVSPIGYPNENKNFFDSLVRLAAGSKNRKNFEDIFFNKNFETPLSEESAGIYKTALNMVRLAPSASNKQPWRIVKDDKHFHFYLDHAKGYSDNLGFDMQRIDIGIALCHFDLTAKETGLKGSFLKSVPSIKPLNENTEYIISWTE